MTIDRERDLEPVADGRNGTLRDVVRPHEASTVDPDRLASIARGLAQSRAGRLASEAEVEAAFALFDV